MNCLILVIPVILAGMLLHFRLKAWGKSPWNILPKCLATWAVVSFGIFGLVSGEGNQNMEKGWILGALILFFLADGLLELKFFLGMAVFGAGHLLLILWILGQKAYTWYSLLLWIGFFGMAMLLFRREIKQGRETPAMYLMLFYPAVLMGMAAMAVVLPLQLGISYLPAALGAFLFAVSDLMVGKNFFHKLSKRMEYLALSLYYAGIFSLSWMIWR